MRAALRYLFSVLGAPLPAIGEPYKMRAYAPSSFGKKAYHRRCNKTTCARLAEDVAWQLLVVGSLHLCSIRCFWPVGAGTPNRPFSFDRYVHGSRTPLVGEL